MTFNANTLHVQGQIAARPLPYHNVIDAYNAAQNQRNTNLRNDKLAAGVFDRVGDPQFNVKRAAARKNQNDMAQALADFGLRDSNWGLRNGQRLLKCQLKSQEYIYLLFQYY